MANLRIPKDFFITTGYGDSDNTCHAGSYHEMLYKMGIAGQNIMTYSSVLPAGANEVEQPNNLPRGAVLECIMSICNGEESQFLNAGIIYAWTYSNEELIQCTGGLVCEINGNFSDEELDYKLETALKEIYLNGFSNEYLGKPTIIKKSFTPQKRYGSVGVAICFVNYE